MKSINYLYCDYCGRKMDPRETTAVPTKKPGGFRFAHAGRCTDKMVQEMYGWQTVDHEQIEMELDFDVAKKSSGVASSAGFAYGMWQTKK